jgi:dTDP-4-amino-4,6-dideoxygalactose transaminase
LHGQNKDALAKTQKGNWKYDIVEAGYKCNMTDLSAAIGLIELARYDNDTLLKRKHICERYSNLLSTDERFELPTLQTPTVNGCYHLYPLRIKGITEVQRDAIMQEIFNQDVSVNVHFIPVPGMSFYKKLGYNLMDYPTTYDLNDAQIEIVVNAVKQGVKTILG